MYIIAVKDWCQKLPIVKKKLSCNLSSARYEFFYAIDEMFTLFLIFLSSERNHWVNWHDFK